MLKKSPSPAPRTLEVDGVKVAPVAITEIEAAIAKHDQNAHPSMKSIIMSIFTRINLVDGPQGSRKALSDLQILGLSKFRAKYELESAPSTARNEELQSDGRERISVILQAADVSLGAAKTHFGDARAEMSEIFGTPEKKPSESEK